MKRDEEIPEKRRGRGVFRSNKEKMLSRIVFGIYLGLLTWLVLFKFATDFSALPHIRRINWIPFYYDQAVSTHLKEVLYNIVVFAPLGVYLHLFFEKRIVLSKCMAVLSVSLLFEAIQFAFAIGVSDVTDLIGNTLGGALGILFCMGLKWVMPRRFVSLINGAGLVIEACGLGLMALLWAANG